MWVFVCLVVALILYFKLTLSKNRKHHRLFQAFPGPTELPLIGSAYLFFGNPENTHHVLSRLRKIYGKRYRFTLTRETFCLNDPKDVEKILTSSTHLSKGDSYNAAKDWLGDGLAFSKGPQWHHHRKLLTPAFHFSILNNFLLAFNHHAKTLVTILEEDMRRHGSLEIIPYIARFTLDSISSTSMGMEMDIQNNRESSYLAAVDRVISHTAARSFNPWLRNKFVAWITPSGREYKRNVATLHEITNNVIQTRRNVLSASVNHVDLIDSEKDDSESAVILTKGKKASLIDILLKAGADEKNALSDTEIRENIDTFMFAGFDTTRSGISWTMHLVATDSKIQAKVHEELDSIFGTDWSDPGREITPADLSEMKYLERCIKESMRLQPPAAFIMRYLESDLVLEDGIELPAGSDVMIPIHSIHMDEDAYPNPEEFDPERFSLENTIKRHAYNYVPFSAGPRNCIGQRYAMMEMKVALAYIFRTFVIQPLQTREEVQSIFHLVQLPNSLLPMKLHKRLPRA